MLTCLTLLNSCPHLQSLLITGIIVLIGAALNHLRSLSTVIKLAFSHVHEAVEPD